MTDSLSRIEHAFPWHVRILLPLVGLASCLALFSNFNLLFDFVRIGVQLYALVALLTALRAKDGAILNYVILIGGFAVFIGDLGSLIFRGLPSSLLPYMSLASPILLSIAILMFLYVIIIRQYQV